MSAVPLAAEILTYGPLCVAFDENIITVNCSSGALIILYFSGVSYGPPDYKYCRLEEILTLFAVENSDILYRVE